MAAGDALQFPAIRMGAGMFEIDKVRVGVIGLGYVGLPLAVEFGRHFRTTGFDIDPARIAELRSGRDRTLEVESAEIAAAARLGFTDRAEDIAACNFFIVTVPTPIDAFKRPDLRPLESASHTIGRLLKPGDVVVYESTVWPGCTEEVCVPILETESGLRFNEDFFAGYSPERINPGDREHRISAIRKVTSGSTPEAAAFVDMLYRRVVTAGTHLAPDIRTAEAAKVIENIQRDVNIALVNEFAILFERLGIDTSEVLAAAGTKWNFLPFRPGLVGGHCIGVDPYYLTHKAQSVGHHPEMILAGRRINDGMGRFVARQTIKCMTQKGLPVAGSRALVLGVTFKEDCPDLRNTRVVDIVDELRAYHVEVDVHDPWADAAEAEREYGLPLVRSPGRGVYDAIVIAVAHEQFCALGAEGIRAFGKPGAVVYDVKHLLPADAVTARL